MLAQLVSGEVDLADVLFLVAAILLGVAAFLQRSDAPAVLALVAWATIAVAWLVR